MKKVNHYNVIFTYDFTYEKTKFPSSLECAYGAEITSNKGI